MWTHLNMEDLTPVSNFRNAQHVSVKPSFPTLGGVDFGMSVDHNSKRFNQAGDKSHKPHLTFAGGDSFSSNSGPTVTTTDHVMPPNRMPKAAQNFQFSHQKGSHSVPQFHRYDSDSQESSSGVPPIKDRLENLIVSSLSRENENSAIRQTVNQEVTKVQSWKTDMEAKYNQTEYNLKALKMENESLSSTISQMKREVKEKQKIQSILEAKNSELKTQVDGIYKMYSKIKECTDGIDERFKSFQKWKNEQAHSCKFFDEKLKDVANDFNGHQKSQTEAINDVWRAIEKGEKHSGKLMKALNDTRKSLADEKLKYQDKVDECESLFTKYTELEPLYTTLGYEVKKLNNEVEEMSQIIQEKSSLLEKSDTEREALQVELNKTFESIKSKSCDVEKLETELERNSKALEEKSSTINNLEGTLKNMTAKMVEKESEVTNLMEVKESLRKSLDETNMNLTEQLEDKKQEMAALELELQTAKSAVEMVQNEKEELAKEKESLSKSVEMARNQSMLSETEHNQEVNELSTRLLDITTNVEEKDKELDRIRSMLEDLQKRLQDQENEIRYLSDQLTKAKGEVNLYQKHKQDKEAQNELLKKEMAAMKNQMERVTLHLSDSPKIRRSVGAIPPRKLFDGPIKEAGRKESSDTDIEDALQVPGNEKIDKKTEMPKEAEKRKEKVKEVKKSGPAPKRKKTGINPKSFDAMKDGGKDKSGKIQRTYSKNQPVLIAEEDKKKAQAPQRKALANTNKGLTWCDLDSSPS